MSAEKRKSDEPRPEAVAYGQALKEVSRRSEMSQREIAGLLHVHPGHLSRIFSANENTVAAKEHLDALVLLVRNSGAEVSDDEVSRLHALRQRAQEASPRPVDRVARLKEEMNEVKDLVGAFRGRLQEAEWVNSQLEEQISRLLYRVQEEEQRADLESRLRREAEERAVLAEDEAGTAHSELTAARRQLTAAAEYARESDATIEAQQQQLRQLRQEVLVLRNQVRRLAEDDRGQNPDGAPESAPLINVARHSRAAEQQRGAPVRTWLLDADDNVAATSSGVLRISDRLGDLPAKTVLLWLMLGTVAAYISGVALWVFTTQWAWA